MPLVTVCFGQWVIVVSPMQKELLFWTMSDSKVELQILDYSFCSLITSTSDREDVRYVTLCCFCCCWCWWCIWHSSSLLSSRKQNEVCSHLRQTNLEVCLEQISKRGYTCQSYLLDASWYGLPQGRRRVYIICLGVHMSHVSVNASEFFQSVKQLLQSLRFTPPNPDTWMAINIVFF